MGIITALEPARGRMQVWVDGQKLCSVGLRIYKKRPLQEGAALDEAEYLDWLSQAQYPDAYESALTYLSSRARSEQEMRVALRRKGYLDGCIDRVVERLTGARLLNDQEFAGRYVESRSAKALGKYALSQQLRRKGIDEETAQEALAPLDDEQQLLSALTLARRLAGRYRGLAAREARAKLSQALARRGFSWDTVSAALTQLSEEDGFPEEEDY